MTIGTSPEALTVVAVPSPNSGDARRGRPGLRRAVLFVRHYVEMVVAMFVGMALFGAALSALLQVILGPATGEEVLLVASAVAMTAAMAVGMVLWMAYRGHRWRHSAVMAAAMFPPAIIGAFLEAGGMIDPLTAGIGSHLGMLVVMLTVMLTAVDSYAHPPVRRPRLGNYLRWATAICVALAIPAVVGVVALSGQVANAYSPPPVEAPVTAPNPPVHDPAKPTVVVVLGAAGAEVGDVMGPYETLSATGALNVYTVAARRDPVPLTGGLDLVPELTFEQLQQRLGADRHPSAVVVPAMPDAGMPSNRVVVDWVTAQHDRGATTLAVCYGARIVADAGLLDGRLATSHWRRLGDLQDSHPEVQWRSGTRYVDDGDVLTTGGVLSGIDGSLRLVERLLGPDAAADASDAIGWPHYHAGSPAALTPTSFSPADLVAVLNAGYRWNHPTVGVLLTDGVGELELVSVFDTYGGQSFAVDTLAVGLDGPIFTRHGLTVVPREALAEAAPLIDRLLVPGTAAHHQSAAVDVAIAPTGLTANYLHDRPGFPLDAGLQDLASHVDVPTARWAAKILEYPTGDLTLAGPGWPWTLTALPLLVFAGTLALFWAPARSIRRLAALDTTGLIMATRDRRESSRRDRSRTDNRSPRPGHATKPMNSKRLQP